MDLTPPLTRSPCSPSTSYCASETSLEYPSPELVAQQYKLTTIYGTGPPCSVTTPVDPDIALPSLETLGQPDWQQATAMHHAVSSSAAVPSILSSEYDAFGQYEAPIHPPHYTQDMYSHSSQEPSLAGTPPPGSLHPRSPIVQGQRPTGSYAPATLLPSSLPHRMKLDTTTADYSQAVDMGHYPSPRSVHGGPYSAEGSYPPSSAGYMSDTHSPSWAQPSEHEPYYAAAAGGAAPHGSQMVPQNRDMRAAAQSQSQARPRRAPRRLTTKEEANFQCEVKGCGKLFSRSYNYKAHMETHDEKREYPFPCLVGSCDKKFVRKTDLQRHNQSVHMKERNFRCDYCARMFARKDTLRRHMDDGCSKRFDIGTLDLRTEGYDGSRAINSSSSSSMGHLALPPSSLPPLAVPSMGSSGMLAPMSNRHEPHHGHGWR